MSFTLEQLRADARYYVFGDSASTKYATTDLDRNINRRYEEAIGIVIKSGGDWQVNGEIALADLVANQREYILPLDILRINAFYVKYETGGEYVKCKLKDPNNIYQEPDQATYGYYPATPEIDLMDNSLFIYLPTATIPAMTNGLKVRYQTDLVELSATDDEPNLAEPFRRYLSIGSAIDYCIGKELWRKKNELEKELAKYETKMIEHYANRINVEPLIITPQQENYR